MNNNIIIIMTWIIIQVHYVIIIDVRVCNNDCDYNTEQTFIEKGEVLDITDTCFSMTHINIRSTSKHLNEFEIFNQSLRHDFDVIAFSETWLNDNTFNLCNIAGYNYDRK